ncbi:uncharacterized protein C11orf86 homolog isoform X2 [Dromiciops gliroides]|uniref:uncharacterized protein C11orf86 homolog isoform X2 n=1 Tax=Dromiciops gliroides TaxID=33562 RepID=UPI001CC6F03B|nr:uncharacterized protein C11orf86 homolog isoform X2 [Dromiciops gliroides]
MVTTRSQSFRVLRPSYDQLQEMWGEPLESKGLSPVVPKGHQKAPRFQRSLSFRHRREKPHSWRQETSSGLPEGLDTPAHEFPTVSLGDTEQLIQGKSHGKQRMQQYKKMNYALRRTWGNFVANLPGVTLSRPMSPSPSLDTSS